MIPDHQLNVQIKSDTFLSEPSPPCNILFSKIAFTNLNCEIRLTDESCLQT